MSPLPSGRLDCSLSLLQLPVGTCANLEAKYTESNLHFTYSPENLRLGNALETFRQRDRVIAGVRDDSPRAKLAQDVAPFAADRILWVRPESAEMTKHATNVFLAVSVTFANELARLCEATGAHAYELERALRSDARIGPESVHSTWGAAFAGGTLARDVVTSRTLANARNAKFL